MVTVETMLMTWKRNNQVWKSPWGGKDRYEITDQKEWDFNFNAIIIQGARKRKLEWIIEIN